MNARKLERLVSDPLDIDKLGRGSYEPRRAPTDVGELVRRVVSESELLLEREVSIADGQATASIDAAKVERIIENLLINAARHTPPDARIWVHVLPCEHGVVIAVEDEGPGVPEEYREAIFEPFRQGPTVRAHSPGVGWACRWWPASPRPTGAARASMRAPGEAPRSASICPARRGRRRTAAPTSTDRRLRPAAPSRSLFLARAHHGLP